MKKKLLTILFLLLIFPLNIYAYSNKVIVGGKTIGIEVFSNGVYVVGHYKVNNKFISKEAGFLVGDIIKEVNNKKISNINDLNNILSEDKEYSFKVLRKNNLINLKLKLVKEANLIKTGLYVKDQINGIGTLSYIDPETRTFGALGHEIIESASLSKFNVDRGNIYKAEVKSINKSSRGITGEKNATIEKDQVLGEISSNEINGIYGKYKENIDTNNTMDIAQPEEIIKGEAYIKTVINDSEEELFKINIISIEDNQTKNILFEITDSKLLESTGGIVQGMSGSPIIQNNKIIGVVNYVIVEEATKGYGIFITKMLEEGDKIG